MNPDRPAVPPEQELTSGRRLARNTAWNLIAQGAPLAVALVVIPLLLHRIGVERFGVLTLIWALVGYASLFDFGLGRALTKLVADRLSQGRREEILPLFWTGLSLMVVVGLVASLLLLLIVPWLVLVALHIPPALADETRRAFQVVALGIPFVTLAAGLRGVLEAHQRFRPIAVINGVLGAFTFLGPLLAVQFVDHLAAMAGAILIARALATVFYFTYCVQLDPDLARPDWRKADAKSLIKFGGWMTISNVLGPLMDNMDRFLLGALTSVTAVAFYATPYDVITRALLIPIAFTGVLFPAFSAALRTDKHRAGNLFVSGTRYVFLAVVPIVVVVTTFAREGLDLWLGTTFAMHSVRIVQWLAAGVLLSALSKVPYALVQANGRPDLTALAHLAELPLYLVAAWLLIGAYGAEGAAIAWTCRILLDSLILFYLAFHQLPGIGHRFVALAWTGIGTFGALYLIAAARDPSIRALLGGLSFVLLLIAARIWILNPGELQQLRSHFIRRRP